MNDLGIFVLCYNRPALVMEAVDSILNQTYKKFDLIISDNSSNELVQAVLQKYKQLTNVQVRRRNPSMQAITHFNQVLIEAQTYKYFMMFHDDDVMHGMCVEKLLEGFSKYPDIAASGCNAYNKSESKKTATIFNRYLVNDTLIRNPLDLINRYFTKTLSHTPFPFYVYNSKKVNGLVMNSNQGGKHCDVSFLCHVVERGPILWSALPLADYRLHDGNDSNDINLRDLISLARFIFTKYEGFYFKMSFVILKRAVKYAILFIQRFF